MSLLLTAAVVHNCSNTPIPQHRTKTTQSPLYWFFFCFPLSNTPTRKKERKDNPHSDQLSHQKCNSWTLPASNHQIPLQWLEWK